jgi:hypothetical protein
VRTFAVALAVGLVLGSLGFRAGEAAEPVGPICLAIDTFRDSFELFATPSGGANFLLSGRDTASGGPVIGSGYVANGAFTFYFMSPVTNSPGFVFRGAIDLTSHTGTGRCFLVDATTNLCGNGEVLQYALIPCG